VSAEDQVLAAATARAEALGRGDRPALEQLLHPQFRWVSHRGQTFDREAYLQANVGGTLQWLGQQLTEVDLVVVGSTAVLRCVVVDEVDAGAGPLRFRMPVTQTWVSDGASWTCLAGHAGPPLDEEAT